MTIKFKITGENDGTMCIHFDKKMFTKIELQGTTLKLKPNFTNKDREITTIIDAEDNYETHHFQYTKKSKKKYAGL